MCGLALSPGLHNQAIASHNQSVTLPQACRKHPGTVLPLRYSQPYESMILEIISPRRSASHCPRILQADVVGRPVGDQATSRGYHRRQPRPNRFMASLNTGECGMVEAIRARTSLVSRSPAATLAFRRRARCQSRIPPWCPGRTLREQAVQCLHEQAAELKSRNLLSGLQQCAECDC
ncbi:hypothetical protein CGRA01v4_10231 [Colletotrichum graminicola]|nr:hypothetical protein CGRA01v4_10231 [Colletotrichum graminicola]